MKLRIKFFLTEISHLLKPLFANTKQHYLIHSERMMIGSFTCELPIGIFKGIFTSSSVMMHLNWSLTNVHTTNLTDYKYIFKCIEEMFSCRTIG